MGSLMPGWSTHPSPKEEALRRCNSSLTKEELQRYWRMKRLSIQEHLEEAHKDAAVSPRLGTSSPIPIARVQLESAQSSPSSTSSPYTPKSDWWTKSNWAFLNDPPASVEKDSHYTPQFDVATKGHMAITTQTSGRYTAV